MKTNPATPLLAVATPGTPASEVPDEIPEPAALLYAQARATRYVGSILEMHRRLSYRGLARTLEKAGAYVARHGFGITTVAARTVNIPQRYLLGITGFRLAQYLQIGYASTAVAAARALFSEPVADLGPDDLHCLTLDDETGTILGYVALVGNGDTAARRLDDADRRPFPVEKAHRIDLLSAVGAPPELHTHEIREVKRFVQACTLHDRERRFRVSLELILSLIRSIESDYPGVRALIGDVEVQVALRHLVLMGLHVTLLEGTTPELDPGDLLHPVYKVRETVEPFYATVPDLPEIGRRAEVVEKVVTSPCLFDAVGLLIREMDGTVHRVSVDQVV